MTWNYRIINRNDELAIHSVYYNDEGGVDGYSETPSSIIGNDLQELKTQLKLLQEALEKDVIELN